MKIYVGNLPYETTDDDLRRLFEDHGAVTSAEVVADRHTSRSKGFGFVVMSDDAEAQKAISAIDGTDFMGRNLRVNESQPREGGRRDDRPPRRDW